MSVSVHLHVKMYPMDWCELVKRSKFSHIH